MTKKPQKVWVRPQATGAPAAAPPADRPVPIPHPPTDLEQLKEDSDSFTLSSFTAEDAWILGNLLRTRLLPHAAQGQPALISISLANSGQTLFQCVTGPGILPDHETWVQRKRNSALRWACSTYRLNRQFNGDETKFKRIFQFSEEQANRYAIHGGAVPIRVPGVEGIVGVVVVSGLAMEEDHGVIADVIRNNWVQTEI